MLRLVSGTYEYPVPPKLIQSFARSWGSLKRDYVLIDEVEDWLVENEIAPSVRFEVQHFEYEPIHYFLLFADYAEALSFVIRWA